jgi:hypothetical protein
MDDKLLAALIGAGAALLAIVIRDIVLVGMRDRSASRKNVRRTKLEKIYSPLMAWMGQRDEGRAASLTIVREDENLRRDVQAYLHLLSEPLREMATEVMTMGRWHGANQGYSVEEQKRIIALSRAFRQQLLSEYRELTSGFD